MEGERRHLIPGAAPDAGTLLVLGATGGTGRQVVRRALAKGYPVTALARHPERLGMQHPALANVARDLTRDPESLAVLLPGHAAVIYAPGKGTSLRAEGLMASVTPALLGPARISRDDVAAAWWWRHESPAISSRSMTLPDPTRAA